MVFERIRGWFGKKKEVEEGVRYVLKRQLPSGGMTKVLELAEPLPMEDLYTTLEPGTYALHKYAKGKSGFEVVWGNTEVLGEAKAAGAEPAAKGVGATRLSSFLEEFKVLREGMKEEYAILGELFGGHNIQSQDAIDILLASKDKYDKLTGIFGPKVTSQNEAPKYDGTLPMWMHPDVIPKLIDNSLNSVETRMKKWGFVEDEEKAEPSQTTIKLPPKPQKKVEEKKDEPKSE